MNPGSQAVQSIHSLHEFEKQHKSQYEYWYKNSRTIVLLSVNSINELESFKIGLELKNICFSEFKEPDLNNSLTSLCIPYSDTARKLCKNLPLGLSEFSKKGGSNV